MLVLAGVSINAIIGDNGVLTRTQYASFLNEMAAVEEAVQLWKAGETIEAKGEESKAIPANGLCKANELAETERLEGEVGYYRLWSLTQTQPTTNVLSDASSFNSAFGDELVKYPAGVQDLYYLNNEALNIKENKTYLIDASTGMIYSVTGIGLKGVRCYSSNMAKAVMNGDSTAPLFAEAEVSGTGSDEKLAGNVEPEYLEDGSKNPNYNPNGFRIIAAPQSNNVFKLYNNGDLYGKGIKGIQLNTSKADMDAISPYVWKEFVVDSKIGSYKKIYPTKAGMFLIDNNDDVWSIGNSYGLTDNQRVEYTGREWIKLDLGEYKAKKVFGTSCAVFIVTTTNELLATGTNEFGQLGTNDKIQRTTFVPISGIPDPNSIERISGNNYVGNGGDTIIKCVDSSNNNHFYYCGTDVWGGLGFGLSKGFSFMTFTEIFTGESGRGNNIANDINSIYSGYNESVLIWFNNGDIYFTGWSPYFTSGKWNLPKVVDVRYSTTLIVLKCDNNGTTEYYGGSSRGNYGLGEGYVHCGVPKLIPIPSDITIKDFNIANDSACYFLTTNGDIYGMGNKSYFGNKDDIIGWTNGMEKLESISEIDSFYGDNFEVNSGEHGQLFLNKDGKYYLTKSQYIMYGDDILQKSWTKVASNVLNFNASNNAYVTRDNNVYIAGADSRQLGLGEISKNQVSVDNYTLITQPEIAGHAKEVYQFSGVTTYILTTDNKLYGTGRSTLESGQLNYSGWDYKDESGNWVYENKSDYVLIKENVQYFIGDDNYQSKALVTTDGKLYAWGLYKNFAGLGITDIKEVTEFTFPTVIGNANNIKKWLSGSSFRSFLLGNDGKMYMGGTGGFDGGFPNKQEAFEEFNYGLSLEAGESIVDIANIGFDNCMMITSNGRLFGFGNANYMGIGRTDSALIDNQLIQNGEINGKKLTQIVAGPNWYLAIDEKGKVYGTGLNSYGVLGRWKGVGRGESNSRYKTAFNWVECPELEI